MIDVMQGSLPPPPLTPNIDTHMPVAYRDRIIDSFLARPDEYRSAAYVPKFHVREGYSQEEFTGPDMRGELAFTFPDYRVVLSNRDMPHDLPLHVGQYLLRGATKVFGRDAGLSGTDEMKRQEGSRVAVVIVQDVFAFRALSLLYRPLSPTQRHSGFMCAYTVVTPADAEIFKMAEADQQTVVTLFSRLYPEHIPSPSDVVVRGIARLDARTNAAA